MNHDGFENKLLSLTRELHRPDPTAQWKDDIIARALREAEPAKTRVLPPRWLMGAWAAAWAAVVALTFSAPNTTPPTSSSAEVAKLLPPVAHPESAPTLLALNRNLQLDHLP